MSVCLYGNIRFKMHKPYSVMLQNWIRKIYTFIELQQENNLYELRIYPVMLKDCKELDDVCAFINTHGTPMESTLKLVDEEETEKETYEVNEGKLFSYHHYYCEENKIRGPIDRVADMVYMAQKINNVYQKHVDEDLVHKIFNDSLTKKEFYDALFSIKQEVVEKNGNVQVFLENTRLDLLPEGAFFVPRLKSPAKPIEVPKRMMGDSVPVNPYLSAIPLYEKDSRQTLMRIEETYLNLEPSLIYSNVQVKITSDDWVSPCSVCKKRLLSLMNDGCTICTPDFMENTMTIELIEALKNEENNVRT